jgi:mannosyl-oligosaccharide alpha-1,2-mannosidase
MYRKTGDPMYREWAWEMFQNMRRHYRTETGWVGLKDVRSPNPGHDNTMQSFFLAETLKYFYLIFSDSDTINLDEWVLNTEAHPIRVMPRDKSAVHPN